MEKVSRLEIYSVVDYEPERIIVRVYLWIDQSFPSFNVHKLRAMAIIFK